MNDILADYREWAAWQLPQVRTHSDRCHMWHGHEACMIHRLAAELEVTRLTDTERDALTTAVYEAEAHQQNSRAATLRGLLERHFPAPENGEKKETTPHPHITPRKGSVPADCTKAGEK